MNKRFAFTLAEVLITLGIIGVVAALTLPTLIQNYKKQEIETKLAKIYSVMNQAIKLSEVEYGDPSNWTLNCADQSNCTIDETSEWFMKYIGKNLQSKNLILGTTPEGVPCYYVYFNDGIIIRGATTYYKDFLVFLNKQAINNYTEGINVFRFRIAPEAQSELEANWNTYHLGKGFEPYAWAWDGTVEGAIHGERYGFGCAAEETGYYCTKLIQINGWKIPEDYPRKF